MAAADGLRRCDSLSTGLDSAVLCIRRACHVSTKLTTTQYRPLSSGTSPPAPVYAVGDAFCRRRRRQNCACAGAAPALSHVLLLQRRLPRQASRAPGRACTMSESQSTTWRSPPDGVGGATAFLLV